MKIKVLVIIALIFCCHTMCATDDSKQYKVVSRGDSIAEIEVFHDCDILVAEIAPTKIDTIYGDQVDGTPYGGTNKRLFTKNQIDPNKDATGVEIIRKDDNRVYLRIKCDSLQETNIKIFSAYYKNINEGYCPRKQFIIKLKKGQEKTIEVLSGNKGEGDTLISYTETTHNASETQCSKQTDWGSKLVDNKHIKGFNKGLYEFLPLIIVLIVGLLIGYILFNQNRKALKALSKECTDLKKIVVNLKKVNNTQIGSYQVMPQKSKGDNSMLNDEIKRFIKEQIIFLQSQSVSSTIQPVTPLISFDSGSINKSTTKEEVVNDTDNVKYHRDDNSFSLEQTDIKIFRIYSKEGEYFYTIVEDSDIREELIGMLQMFEGCITYQTTVGVAKRIEPVTDGKLRKDGNKFYVDTNNKLVVRFT